MTLLQRNSRKQGDVGLGMAISWFTKQGYCISIPLTDNQEYDLVVEYPSTILNRVQVKTTRNLRPSNSYSVELRTKGGNKTGTSVKRFDGKATDWVFVLTDDDSMYLIPATDLDGLGQIVLGTKWDKYKINGSCPARTRTPV